MATTPKGSHNKNNGAIVRHLRSRPLFGYTHRRSRPAVMHSATPLGSYCGGYSAICDIVAKTNDITAKRMCSILLFPCLLKGEELVGHLLGARGVEELG